MFLTVAKITYCILEESKMSVAQMMQQQIEQINNKTVSIT